MSSSDHCSGKGKAKGNSRGKPAPPPVVGTGAGKGKAKSKGDGSAPKKSWAAPSPSIVLKNDNAETLRRMKDAECYSGDEVLDASCIDWTLLEDVAVIKGSLEIDESMTGIVLAQVAGKLVAFRNICGGRGADPIKEYFAMVLNQILNEQRGCGENSSIRLAKYRVNHLFANDEEYQRIRTSLRTCIQTKTGLKGVANELEDDDPHFWVSENEGFNDFSHDLIRVLDGFFAMSKKHAFGRRNQIKETGGYTAETVRIEDRSQFNTFTGVMEVVKGLSTMQDKMTLADEVQINLAMGLARDDPKYIQRTHDNPLYNNSSESVRAKMLWEMGKITAFDALVNNWDRISVSLLWDNKGNFTNVVVEMDTLRVVGIDQFVNPIDKGAGLDTYRKRLETLVEYVAVMSENSFNDDKLEELDASTSLESLVQSIMDFEAMLETRAQATVFGQGSIAQRQEDQHQANKHDWLQDLQKKLINATGSFFELNFLAKHFVRGMADGFRTVSFQGEEGDEILRRTSDMVAVAFDCTTNKQLDLRGNLRRCTEFVSGNGAVVAKYF